LAVDGDKSTLLQWLPENAWERQPCKVLETSQGTIYFQDYQTEADGSIRVFPFTMLIRSESLSVQANSGQAAEAQTSKQPIILRASKSANLQFDRPLVLGTSGAGKLQNGQLEGFVHVFQPDSSPNKRDGLSIWTSNVHMTPLKIYSLEDIDFNLGPHVGAGRSFNIDLSHDTPLEAINTDFSKINGVKRLELAFLKSLRLNPEPKSAWGSRSTTPAVAIRQPAATAEGLVNPQREPADPLDVTCAGPFVFDFDKLTASFENQVRVQRALEPGDRITGNRLDIFFNQEFAPQTADTDQPERADLSRLRIKSIQVTGQPAQLQLVSQHAEIRAEELEYDLIRQQVFARDSRQVVIEQPQQTFRAREIQYRLREDQSLGPLVAQGPGEVIYLMPARSLPTRLGESVPATNSPAATAPREFVVRWQGRLTIEPDEQQRLITLDGGATLTLDKTQQLSGQRLRMWLWAQPQVDTPQANPAVPVNTVPTDAVSPNRWTYLPIQTEVDGEVWVAHPDFAGLTHRLTAKWPVADRLEEQRVQLFRSSEPVARTPAVPLLPPAPQFNPQQPDAALRFASQEILVRLNQTESMTELQSLRLDRQVQVNQWDFARPQEAPTTITGGRLHVKPLGEQIFHLAVLDNAAVKTAAWQLYGPELHFDQQANRIWINGDGQAIVRGQVDPAGTPGVQTSPPTGLLGGITSDTPTDIEITWKAGMIFDGEKLYFENQVVADIRQPLTEQSGQMHLQSRSEALSLVLAEPIELKQVGRMAGEASATTPNRLGTKNQVKQLILVNQLLADQRVFVPKVAAPVTNPPVVLVRQLFDQQQVLQTKQVLIAPNLDIFPESEQFEAAGPGQLIQWQRGSPQSTTGQPKMLTVSSPLEPRQSTAAGDAINYLHVLFDTSLRASGKPAELRLKGRIRGLYGNVASFETESNPDRNKPDKGLLKLSCDDLHVIQWQRRSEEQAFWELIAQGSANFIGESFEATAARMSYDERSGKLKIDGGDRGDANLWYQAIPTSSQRDHLVAEQIAYWPETQRAEIEKVRNATINRGPGGSR
jgi:hypothetical protein